MTAESPIDLDPIITEIIARALTAATEEIEIAILRSAYSHVVKESQDASCAIFTAEGRIVAQPIAIPGHLGSMKFMLEECLKEFPSETLADGDVLMTNDPYRGGSHLPDIAIFQPVFRDGALIAFVSSLAHHADVGGMVPGSNPLHATELFQEGLIIPPVKFMVAGAMNKTAVDMIQANTRLPDVVFGDLRAQSAALQVGQRRLSELCDKYGAPTLVGVMNHLIETTRRRVRAEVAAMPDGVYEFEDFMDDDGINLEKAVKIRCRMEIKGDRIHLDFAGTDPQLKGPLNAPTSKTWTTALYCLMAVLPDDIAFNDGVIDTLDITIPEGTLLNPAWPAPVNARSITVNRIADVVLGAFGLALPDRVGGQSCGTPTGISFGGKSPETGRNFVFYESYSGGMGGTQRTSGADGVSTGTSNAMNIPAEAVELDFPIRIVRYALVPNSGGAGKHRGGLGLLREYEMLADEASMNIRGDRAKFAPQGNAGGEPGAPARYVLNPDTAEERVLGSKTGGGRIRKGDRLRVTTPGGGGYGNPAERDPAELADDIANGKVAKR
jgi:N-methylhydantoinase B